MSECQASKIRDAVVEMTKGLAEYGDKGRCRFRQTDGTILLQAYCTNQKYV